MAALITVSRAAPDELGSQYPITLSLDGQRIATLRPGESAMHPITPGRHWLRAHNTLLSKTVEFEVATDEQVRFRTTNRSNLLTTFFALMGAGALSVTLERVEARPASGR